MLYLSLNFLHCGLQCRHVHAIERVHEFDFGGHSLSQTIYDVDICSNTGHIVADTGPAQRYVRAYIQGLKLRRRTCISKVEFTFNSRTTVLAPWVLGIMCEKRDNRAKKRVSGDLMMGNVRYRGGVSSCQPLCSENCWRVV